VGVTLEAEPVPFSDPHGDPGTDQSIPLLPAVPVIAKVELNIVTVPAMVLLL
jgi:hypothetical protein